MVKGTLYCGGPFIGLQNWLSSCQSCTDLADAWPQFAGRCVIGTYRGRSAAALACRLLGIGPGHEVLVPAYNCGTEIDAILHSGARVVGYQVSRRCEIDLGDLIARRSSRTRAVYLIHYFGWEQPMKDLRRWCDDQGLLLIEDCALALFSQGTTGAIGRTGDAAIYSLPKTLGCYHGGLISLPLSHAAEIPPMTPVGVLVLLKEIWHSARAHAFVGLEQVGLYGAVLAARRRLQRKNRAHATDDGFPQMPDSYHFNPETDADRGLHTWLYAVAGSVSCEEIVRRRRSNYLRLAGALDGIQGMTLLYPELPEGVCPLSLPLLVSDRNACAKALQALGITAPPWWAGFHHAGIDWSQYPDACCLKQNLLTLPVHHGLDDLHLDHVAETLAHVLGHTIANNGNCRP